MRKNGYMMLCTAMFCGLAAVQYFGWCFSDYDKVPDVPNTVRSNPGSYRSHYSSHYVHIGGK